MSSVHDVFERFRTIRAEIDDAPPEEGAAMVREGGVLGVGILLGGGFPGSAAAVTRLLERQYPDGPGWPWDGGAEA